MKVNVYEMVTKRIIEQLDKGVIPWRKTWHGSYPRNYVSGKEYHGINLLLLPYGGEYLTFKQVKDVGGRVKKGEKSHIVVFFTWLESKDEKENKEVTNKQTEYEETDDKNKIPFLKYSNVFHISQCEGIKSKLNSTEIKNDIKSIEKAEIIMNDYIKRSGVKLVKVEGCNTPCYIPLSDSIVLPVISQFENSNEFYSTAFHECSHSTGHKSRLDRFDKHTSFGSKSYSNEELIAEIATVMIMNYIGIELESTFKNSVAYINGWRNKLSKDSKLIIRASSQAQKACDMILNKELSKQDNSFSI